MMELIIIHFLIGPMLLLVALVTKHFPPKKINSFYGYRTTRSMRSDSAWQEANRYSTMLMIRLACLTIAFQLLAFFLVSIEMSLSLSAVFLGTGLIVLIILTEKHLKSLGDSLN